MILYCCPPTFIVSSGLLKDINADVIPSEIVTCPISCVPPTGPTVIYESPPDQKSLGA